jgi:hypothetical protein
MPTQGPPKPIPLGELQTLVKLMLETYESQYQVIVDPASLTYRFITPRTDTRIGFEIQSTASSDYFLARLYAVSFTNSFQGVNPYRQEEKINVGNNAPGNDVFVTISDLPLGLFPILSQTLLPTIGSTADPGAIQLEDLSGFIDLEDGSGQWTSEGGQ